MGSDFGANGSGPRNFHFYSSTVDPTAANDMTQGVVAGSFWINTNTGRLFVCRSPTTNAAIWVALPLSGGPPYIANNWYAPDNQSFGVGGTAPGTTSAFAVFGYLRSRCTIGSLGVRVTTTSAANSLQLAIYNCISEVNPKPGTLIGNTGSLSTTSAAVVTGALSQGNQQLEAGPYWFACQHNNVTSATQVMATGEACGAIAIGDPTASNVSIGANSMFCCEGWVQTFGSWASTLSGVTLTPTNAAVAPAVLFLPVTVP